MANTTMMRVNDVIIINIAGRNVSAVISARICRVTEYSSVPFSPGCTENAGILGRSAMARAGASSPVIRARKGPQRFRTAFTIALLFVFGSFPGFRSEERRVGEEWRERGQADTSRVRELVL